VKWKTWWTRSRLRTKIFCAFSALILAVLLITLWFSQLVISRQAQATLQQELATTGQVFKGLLDERVKRLQTNATLLVRDYALQKVIASYDPPTIASALLSYQQRLVVDLLWATDETGKLLADSLGKQPGGNDLTRFSPLAEALASGEAAVAITEVDGALFQLLAIPVLGPDIIGFLLLGHEINAGLAEQLEENTGSHVTFVTKDRLFASSWPAPQRDTLLLQTPNQPDFFLRPLGETFLLSQAGERFLSIIVPVPSYLSVPLYVVLQRSYDKALLPLFMLQRRLVGIGIGALLLSLIVGRRLARDITSPVQTLVTGMQEILKGHLSHRLHIRREDEIGFLAHSFNEMAAGLEKGEEVKDTFGRFVSQDVATAVLNGSIPLTGEHREVTILFQDIRGFTSISEKLDPAELLRILNLFFTEVVAAVEAEEGVVMKFTGDGVMAVFGAPVAHVDDPARAVRAAVGLVQRLAQLNTRLTEQHGLFLRIGIGIHTGDVIAGKIGPDARVEYGVVGDPVNLASRIEGLTKELQTTILVSQTTASKLGLGFTFGRTAVLAVKGKEKPVGVVEILPQAKEQQPSNVEVVRSQI
jgi:class 3 adenylate cyclase